MTKPLAQVLLAPQSVAIIGQSNDATKTAGRPLKYLRQAGYAGRIYPINPRRDEVLGEKAWPSLGALPEVPDHTYIVASTEATMEAIEECCRIGVPVVTALANGFSETGDEGTAREARIRELLKTSGTRLVGPSSLGVVDLRHKALFTANAAFDEPDLPVGRIYPVNPRRDEVLGERAWPSLKELPELPEHAYIVASTEATMEAIEECARLGVPVVTAQPALQGISLYNSSR